MTSTAQIFNTGSMSGNYLSMAGVAGVPWQSALSTACADHKLLQPEYNLISDRRGGRTAWSATVKIAGIVVSARYWYDGQFVNSAKEDAAEVALKNLANLLSNKIVGSL